MNNKALTAIARGAIRPRNILLFSIGLLGGQLLWQHHAQQTRVAAGEPQPASRAATQDENVLWTPPGPPLVSDQELLRGMQTTQANVLVRMVMHPDRLLLIVAEPGLAPQDTDLHCCPQYSLRLELTRRSTNPLFDAVGLPQPNLVHLDTDWADPAKGRAVVLVIEGEAAVADQLTDAQILHLVDRALMSDEATSRWLAYRRTLRGDLPLTLPEEDLHQIHFVPPYSEVDVQYELFPLEEPPAELSMATKTFHLMRDLLTGEL